MSTTIITAIKAAAVIAPQTGQPVYIGPAANQSVIALFEQAYESNVFPKTPHWCMRYVGDLRGAMEFILKAAGGCEGGGLRWQKERHTQPESCVRRWRRALAAPVRFAPAGVQLRFGGSYMGLPQAGAPIVRAILEKYPGIDVSRADDPDVSIDLARSGAWDAVCELVSRSHETGALPWRLFTSGPPACDPDAALGILKPAAPRGDVTKRGKRTAQVFDLCSLEGPSVVAPGAKSHRDHLAVYPDGEVHVGWPYSLVGHFAASRVLCPEMSEPGVAEPLIAAMRDLVERSGPLPMQARLKIPRVSDDRGSGADWDALAAALQLTIGGTPGEPGQLDVSAAELQARGLLGKVITWLRRTEGAKVQLELPASDAASNTSAGSPAEREAGEAALAG